MHSSRRACLALKDLLCRLLILCEYFVLKTRESGRKSTTHYKELQRSCSKEGFVFRRQGPYKFESKASVLVSFFLRYIACVIGQSYPVSVSLHYGLPVLNQFRVPMVGKMSRENNFKKSGNSPFRVFERKQELSLN